MPGELRIPAPAEKIQAMRTMLQHLVQAGTLRRSWSRPLEMHLDHVARAIAEADVTTATEMLTAFHHKVLSLHDKERLSDTAAAALIALADRLIEDLQP